MYGIPGRGKSSWGMPAPVGEGDPGVCKEDSMCFFTYHLAQCERYAAMWAKGSTKAKYTLASHIRWAAAYAGDSMLKSILCEEANDIENGIRHW